MKIEHFVITAPRYPGQPNEDAARVEIANGKRPFVACVVDGHGGGRRKSRLVHLFSRDIAKRLCKEGVDDSGEIDLVGVCERTGAYIKTDLLPVAGSVGAVVGVLVVEPSRVHYAHVGDTRLYQYSLIWPHARQVGIDHDAQNSEELERLAPFIDAGTHRIFNASMPSFNYYDCDRLEYMREDGSWGGGLMPTRAFGDLKYGDALLHVPEKIHTILLDSLFAGYVFVLCSDGANEVVEQLLERMGPRGLSMSFDELQREIRMFMLDTNDDATLVFVRVIL